MFVKKIFGKVFLIEKYTREEQNNNGETHPYHIQDTSILKEDVGKDPLRVSDLCKLLEDLYHDNPNCDISNYTIRAGVVSDFTIVVDHDAREISFMPEYIDININ